MESMANQMRAASAYPPPSGIDLDQVMARGRRQRRRRRTAASAVAVLATFGVTAGIFTGLQGGTQAGRTPVGAITSSTASASPTPSPSLGRNGLLAGKKLPFAAYDLSLSEVRLVSNAQNVLTNECVARFGFPAALRLKQATPDRDYVLEEGRRFGLTDPDVAATWGYHMPEPPRPTSPTGIWTHKLSEQEQVVLYGWTADHKMLPSGTRVNGVAVPDGGCMGEAGRHLDDDPYMSLSDTVFRQFAKVERDAEADRRVQAKIQEWVSCMRGHGYQVTGFWSGRPDLTRFMNDAKPSALEIQTAITDVACNRQVGLAETWFAVMSADQNAQIRTHPTQFEALKKLHDGVLAAAEQIMEAAPDSAR